MANANICIQEGMLVGKITKSFNRERNIDQADFSIEQIRQDENGKTWKNKVLCRLLGKEVQNLTHLPEGTPITIDGRLRYRDYQAYVEGFTISYGDARGTS